MDLKTSEPKRKPSGRISRISKGPVEKGELSIRARLWLDVAGETYLAPGRVTLLERIGEYGSITKAAKSMKMSYRHAWLLVDDMNKKAPSPLLIRKTGGKGGGGTKLSAEGKKAVNHFNRLRDELASFVEGLK